MTFTIGIITAVEIVALKIGFITDDIIVVNATAKSGIDP